MKCFEIVKYVLAVCIFLTACSKEKTTTITTVDITEVNFKSTYDTIFLQIHSSYPWDLSDIPSWIEARPKSGNKSTRVALIGSFNTSDSARFAVIKLKADAPSPLSIPISVRQAQSPVIINSFTNFHFPGDVMEIHGRGFSSTPGKNIVYLNRWPAEIIHATSGQLEVRVPAGTGMGKVRVVVNQSSGESEENFVFLPR